MQFIFPAHPTRPTIVEPTFGDQWSAFASSGFDVAVCPDAVVDEGKPFRGVVPGAEVVYRGWMLNARQYERLALAVEAAAARLITSQAAYLAAHHLPNWYPLVAEFTPETRVLPLESDWEAELRSLGWDAYFVKDYVKSLKTSRGSVVRDPGEIGAVVAEMRHFRGEIEGGLCVRRVESFIADSECRYFVLGGRPFSPDGGMVPEPVERIASRIPSPFFSVDVVSRADGEMRIVEIGDGQVSDLVGWTAEQFVEMWMTHLAAERSL